MLSQAVAFVLRLLSSVKATLVPFIFVTVRNAEKRQAPRMHRIFSQSQITLLGNLAKISFAGTMFRGGVSAVHFAKCVDHQYHTYLDLVDR